MNLNYVFLRLVRHFTPEAVARFLLKRRWIIRPGGESSNPARTVEKYLQALSDHGMSVQNARVMIFGYGGRFAVGVDLLRRGARHVVLCDHFVLLDEVRNLELLPDFESYLALENGRVRPRAEHITMIHGDIRSAAVQRQIQEVDIVLSASVLEHLDDVDGVMRALARLTADSGVNLHLVDLRDHYFKYPFEMLTYSEIVWKRLLNPTSNLNRFRVKDYQNAVARHFERVQITIVRRNLEEFRKALPRIRPEFLTGDESEDSVESINVLAEKPRP